MSVEFTDNTGQAKAALKRASEQAVEKALLILEAQIKANAPVSTGDLRDSIKHNSNWAGDIIWGRVGSPLMYAIYVEFGTGEFAENGAGRKGGWSYKDSSGEWFFTWGMSPQKFMRKAFRTKKNQVKQFVGKEIGASFQGGAQ